MLIYPCDAISYTTEMGFLDQLLIPILTELLGR